MNIINKLLFSFGLMVGFSNLLYAVTEYKGITLDVVSAEDGAVTAQGSGGGIEAVCPVNSEGLVYFILLRNGTGEVQDQFVETTDHYKMIWTTMNTAVALGRPVNLSIQPIGSQYGTFCFVVGAGLTAEVTSP